MNINQYLNLKNIQWDIVIIIISCPLYNAFWRGYGVFQILMAPIAILFLYYTLTVYNRKIIKNYVIVYLLMLSQWIWLTIAFEMDVFQYSKVFLLALLVLIHPISNNTGNLIYPLLAIVGTVVGYEMILNQNMVDSVRLSLQIGDTLQDPNWIAIFLFAPFCCGLRLMQNRNYIIRLLGLVLTSFSAYVVFLTGSRGALLGLIVSFFVWLRLSFKQFRGSNFILVIAAFMLVGYLFLTYLIPNVDVDLLGRYTANDIGEDRTPIWIKLLSEYRKGDIIDVLFGRGPGSVYRDIGMSAHNMFLEQIYQMGLIGFILMIVFVFQIFKDTINCNNLIGLYIITALFTLSLTTPIWGHIYFMTPLVLVAYVNNANTEHRNVSYKAAI